MPLISLHQRQPFNSFSMYIPSIISTHLTFPPTFQVNATECTYASITSQLTRIAVRLRRGKLDKTWMGDRQEHWSQNIAKLWINGDTEMFLTVTLPSHKRLNLIKPYCPFLKSERNTCVCALSYCYFLKYWPISCQYIVILWKTWRKSRSGLGISLHCDITEIQQYSPPSKFKLEC